jgi:hypothetical protein
VQKKHFILLSPIISLLWLVLTVVIGGLTYSDYNHSSQFMSELGAVGSPFGTTVNYFGFLPTEIFMLFFIGLVFTSLPKTKTMIAGLLSHTIYAVALCIASTFPCDFECRPIQPSLSHDIHIISGMSAYLFAIVGIILLAFDSRKWSNSKTLFISGLCLGTLAFTLLLNIDPDSRVVGLIQRTTELTIYSWFLIFAVKLYKYLPNKE